MENETPAPAENPSSSISTSAAFETAAATVPDVIGTPVSDPAAPAGAGIVLDPTKDEKIARLSAGITAASVEHWLVTGTNALANMLGSDDYKLNDFEKGLFVPSLQIIAEKHLPALLAKTDSPEWATLGTAVLIYGGRVAVTYKMRQMANKEKTENKKPWGQTEPTEVIAPPQPAERKWGRPPGTEPV